LYAGYSDVWKSNDQGNSWAPISSNLSSYNLTSLVVAPSNSNTIYAANPVDLWRTTNGGTTWVNITSGIPTTNGRISYIAVDPADANKVYVTLNRFASGNKVFKSTNGGSSWTNFSGSLPNLPANCITVQPGGNDALYLGMDVGVYYRDGSMSDWILFNTGLPNVIVGELECKTTAGKIYAGTFGRGLWESNLFSSSSNNTLTISPATQNVNPVAGSATLNITSNTSWTVSDDASWLTLSPTSGTGNATINATYTANTGTNARTATITATGGGFSPTAQIVQSGTGSSSCNPPTGLQVFNITQTTVGVSWSAVSGASSYTPQIRLLPNGAWNNLNPATYTNTSITLSNLTAGNSYELKVKTNCSNNLSSNWSGTVSFTTLATPSCNTPVGLQSANITQTSVLVSWTAVSGASSYALQTRLAPNGTWSNTNPPTTTGTSITINSLSPNTAYEWRVRTNCSNGLTSDWSNGVAFTTLPVPTCNTPGNLQTSNITQNSVLMSWSAVSGAASYSLQTRLMPNGAWVNTNPASFTNTAITISGFSPNTSYQWRVSTNCTNGLTSAWSNGVTFTTLPALTCNAPATLTTSSITQNTALLSWSAVSGAASYKVQFYNNGWYDMAGSPFTSTSVSIYGLFANSYFEWRVITNCTNGLQSAPSGVASFYTSYVPSCYNGTLFPSYDLNPASYYQYVNYMYGGDYSVVNVTAGNFYSFSFCSANGGYLAFDGEIYLRTIDGGTMIAYNDDNCGTAPKIVWQAGFTGQAQVFLVKHTCQSQYTYSTLAYRIGTSLKDDQADDRDDVNVESVAFALDTTQPTGENMAFATDNAGNKVDMQVYPNPSSGDFTVDFNRSDDNTVVLEVYDAIGNLMWKKEAEVPEGLNTWEVKADAWRSGIYFLRLYSGRGTQLSAQKVFLTR
jgi:hypothetical protein